MNREERRQRARRTRARGRITNMFGALDGAEIPGGCDDCDAYQTVRPITAGGWSLTTHHDDWCPWWTTYRRRRTA
jgi:hypothetical protein